MERTSSLLPHQREFIQSLGHVSTRLVAKIAAVRTDERVMLLMRVHFDFVCPWSRKTLQLLTKSMAVVDAESVDAWLDTSTNLSETARTCCGVSVLSLTQATTLPKWDWELTFMMLQTFRLHIFVCFVLYRPDSGVAVPTGDWKGTIRDVEPFQ